MSIKIGLEIHCRLDTKSKLFCSCASDSTNKHPNQETCPICLGFPGYKPRVNKKAIEHVIRIGIGLDCNISEKTYFSRKTYFYPDMSKNFQITQYEVPIAIDGKIKLGEDDIHIKRVHLEEDPARIVYANGNILTTKYILVDYNRAGAPLAEIVTEPDIKSPQQARMLLEKISMILEYLGVYDSSKEASIRVDANISSNGSERVEIKNITGFENVEKALSYESVRQSNMLRINKQIERETRHFDESTKTTSAMRSKEFEEDYGYIFDPDLPLINIDEIWLNSIKSTLPELPDMRSKRIATAYGLNEYEANVLVYTDKQFVDFFERCVAKYNKPKEISKWMINYLLKSLNWRSERIANSKVSIDGFLEFLNLIESGTITERYAKELIKTYVDTGESPKKLISAAPLNNEPLEEIIKKVVLDNMQAYEEFKAGKAQALQYLIGKVLKANANRSDPQKIVSILNSMVQNK